MEPDNVFSASPSNHQTLHTAGAPPELSPALNHEAALNQTISITSFSEAVAALSNHSFPSENRRSTNVLISRATAAIESAGFATLETARSQLHPINNFLPHIVILHASLVVVENDDSRLASLLSDVRLFISMVPPHFAKKTTSLWIGICRHAVRLSIENHHNRGALSLPLSLSLVRPIREAANKLATCTDSLVPLHADFLAVCLDAKCYRVAAEWIREQRRDVSKKTGLTASDVHLIFHYSALVMVGVKEYREALQCCRLALSVPAPSPSPFFDVASATYRVYVLLCLLVTGWGPPSLKFSSYAPSRLRQSASEYLELVVAFERMDKSATYQIYESNRTSFEKHSNFGLVKQVMNDLSKRLIIRLTNSYVTMKMDDMAKRAGLKDEEEAHTMLLNMVREKKICASIDEREGVVSLMENDRAEEAQVAEKLSSRDMNHCLNIVRRVEDFREELEKDPVYIMKGISADQAKRPGHRRGGFGGGAASSPADMDAEYVSNGNVIDDSRDCT